MSPTSNLSFDPLSKNSFTSLRRAIFHPAVTFVVPTMRSTMGEVGPKESQKVFPALGHFRPLDRKAPDGRIILDASAPNCGICGEPLEDAVQAQLHRIRHRVPAEPTPATQCAHAQLFVVLRAGRVQIVPLVVDARARCVPRKPWSVEVLPIEVRRVLEVQNLKDPKNDGPYLARDEQGARELDGLYHRLGGPRVLDLNPMPPEDLDWGDSPEHDHYLKQLGPLEYAVERAKHYRTAPPEGFTDEELVALLLHDVADLGEKELRYRLFSEGLIESPDTVPDLAIRRLWDVRQDVIHGAAGWLDDDALTQVVLGEFPGVDEADLRSVLAGWGPNRQPEVHGPYSFPELVRLAAAEGRPWELVELRLLPLVSRDELRSLHGLFNRVAGLMSAFGDQFGGYWCGKCEGVHYLRAKIGERHGSYRARRHAVEPV